MPTSDRKFKTFNVSGGLFFSYDDAARFIEAEVETALQRWRIPIEKTRDYYEIVALDHGGRNFAFIVLNKRDFTL